MKNSFYPNDLARNGTGKCPACSDMLPHSGNLGQVLTRTWEEKKEHLSFENIRVLKTFEFLKHFFYLSFENVFFF